MTRNMLQATAAFVNATGGTNGDNPSELTRSDVDEIIRTLVTNNSYTIDKVVVSKSLLIDLEVYGESYDDRAQAEPLALAA